MRTLLVLMTMLGATAALAQAQPARPASPSAPPPVATPQPGFVSPPAAQPGATASVPDPAPEITSTEVSKEAKTGRDVFIGSYIQVDRTCKVGPTPKIEQPEPPKNGVIKTRPMPINLTSAPGVPRNKCLGVSPAGIGVYYQGKWRFKGDDSFVYRVRYADGRIREVRGTVKVQ